MSIMVELETGGRYQEDRKYEFRMEGLYLWDDEGKWELIPWHRIHGIKPA